MRRQHPSASVALCRGPSGRTGPLSSHTGSPWRVSRRETSRVPQSMMAVLFPPVRGPECSPMWLATFMCGSSPGNSPDQLHGEVLEGLQGLRRPTVDLIAVLSDFPGGFPKSLLVLLGWKTRFARQKRELPSGSSELVPHPCRQHTLRSLGERVHDRDKAFPCRPRHSPLQYHVENLPKRRQQWRQLCVDSHIPRGHGVQPCDYDCHVRSDMGVGEGYIGVGTRCRGKAA